MPDPRERDPRFPDRPTHPDFIRLSEAAQNHDAMTEQLNVNPFAVVGVDEDSFVYFLRNRMAIVSQRMHRDFTNPRFMALYMDAFALGKRYAEMAAEDQTPKVVSSHAENTKAVDVLMGALNVSLYDLELWGIVEAKADELTGTPEQAFDRLTTDGFNLGDSNYIEHYYQATADYVTDALSERDLLADEFPDEDE